MRIISIKLSLNESAIVAIDYRGSLLFIIPMPITKDISVYTEKYQRGLKVTIYGMTFWNVSEVAWSGAEENAPHIHTGSDIKTIKTMVDKGKVMI